MNWNNGNSNHRTARHCIQKYYGNIDMQEIGKVDWFKAIHIRNGIMLDSFFFSSYANDVFTYEISISKGCPATHFDRFL